MRKFCMGLFISCALSWCPASGQGTAPTFQYRTSNLSYTLAGHDPAGGTTVIPVVLVSLTLSFEAGRIHRSPSIMDAAPDVQRILRSPVFARFPFGPAGNTQYADAMLRTMFPAAKQWHILLGKPLIEPLKITVPVGYGYVLSSKRTGTFLAMADAEFLQREIFKRIPRLDGKLVIAVTHNTAYYAYGDATVCCSWGTHGVDSATGNSFVLASYLRAAPPIVQDKDVQPLTEQLAEYVIDPLRDPLFHPVHGQLPATTGNVVPAWRRPAGGGCGGVGIAATYTLLEPTDTNPRSDVPVSKPFIVNSGGRSWHVQNVALLRWYLDASDSLRSPYSFPDARGLTSPATPCPLSPRTTAATSAPQASPEPTSAAIPLNTRPNGHRLIGYWTSRGPHNSVLRLRDVPPQWDIVIVAFAVPDPVGPEGSLVLRIRPEIDLNQMKEDIHWLKSHGKKVMISLGGGGQYFKLNDPKSIPNFVSSVTQIVSGYDFDGVDLDFETPSLVLDPGDADFRHPTTPSVVNLISGLRQLREHFGPEFMISLVPEGTQLPAAYVAYGGQFGSYLAVLWGIRDILSFVDTQDYNTPPLEGLDGEIYQLGSADYHTAITELLLHGFQVGRDPRQFFPPVPADKVAVGFLVGAATPKIVSEAMDSLIIGKRAPGTAYKLRKPGGYSNLVGAMFWTIDADRIEDYRFSNQVGPQLHAYPAVK
jgi:chitinase